jgi:hypothetical protein
VYSDLHAMFSPMTRGDLMKSTTRENGAFQWTGWVVGSASLLLLISAGLELFVQRTLGHSSVATVTLDLFLAFWTYVPGPRPLVFPLRGVARAVASCTGDTSGHEPMYPYRTEEPRPRKARAGSSSIPRARGRYWCSDPIDQGR